MPKYKKTKRAFNNADMYQETFDSRGVPEGIRQNRTTFFGKDLIEGVSTFDHIWSMGDRYFKLAYKYYGAYEHWWVIALVNNAPTEGHLEYGDVIKIPSNPYDIARRM